MRKLHFILIASSLYVSCTSYELNGESAYGYISTIDIAADSLQKSYDEDDFTRGIVWYTGSNNFSTAAKYKNYFTHWDTVGIFPTVGDQIPFPLTSIPIGSPATNYAFVATGWNLRNDVNYYAYWPFDRKNYKDGINKEHIYIKYFGQKNSLHTGQTSTGNLKMDDDDLDSIQCMYSYMYSDETAAASGSNSLAFSMHYFGGILRVYCDLYGFPPSVIPGNVKVILMQIVAPDDRFILEGTYDLQTVAQTGTPTITPSARGKSNKISLVMNDLPVVGTYTYAGVTYATVYSLLCLHSVSLKNCTFNFYDQDYNCYSYKYTASKSISPGNTLYLTIAAPYVYKASPDSIKINPWDEEEETINSNWNYK